MTPFGEHAVRFATPPSIAARRDLLARLRRLEGVRDVVLCEEVGCVVLAGGDAAATPLLHERARSAIAAELAAPARAIDSAASTHDVRVVYDGEDLDAVAAAIGRTREAVIALHSEADYRVSMLGFLPGFAYLRGLAPELCLPRRAPRPRVPAHSVAIGAEYTGIYPVASAGGWHLLGRALGAPRVALGDVVRFAPSDGATDRRQPTEDVHASPTPEWRGPHLVVVRLAGLALLVDRGRAGQMHEGMPPGGPLVARAFACANALAGNAPGACAIELTGTLEVTVRGGVLTVADDQRVVQLHEGERFIVASGPRRVAYLALGGGIDAPLVHGSRGALASAGIGRPLRRGDLVLPGDARDAASDPPRHSRDPDTPIGSRDRDALIALLPGPDTTDALRDAIEATDFAISPTSDRAGTRLEGPPLLVETPFRAGTRASTPMIEGAIELTPSGLVVLGPDHPTTGGYPVVAVLAAPSRDAFFARALGARVRFRF